MNLLGYFSIFTLLFLLPVNQSLAKAKIVKRGMYSSVFQGKNSNELKSEPVSAHWFTTTIECSIKCADRNESRTSLRRNFMPDQHGLAPGNGYSSESPMLGGFALTLTGWGNRECIRAAENECGAFSKIESAQYSKMSSGPWSIDKQLSCDAKAGVVYSPYETGKQLERDADIFNGTDK